MAFFNKLCSVKIKSWYFYERLNLKFYCFLLLFNPLWNRQQENHRRVKNLNPAWLHHGLTTNFGYLTSVLCPCYYLFTITNSFLQWWETPLLLNNQLGHFRHWFFNLKLGWADPLGHSCKQWLWASPAPPWGSPGSCAHCMGCRSLPRGLHSTAHPEFETSLHNRSERLWLAAVTCSLFFVTHREKQKMVRKQWLVFFVEADFTYFTSMPSTFL